MFERLAKVAASVALLAGVGVGLGAPMGPKCLATPVCATQKTLAEKVECCGIFCTTPEEQKQCLSVIFGDGSSMEKDQADLLDFNNSVVALKLGLVPSGVIPLRIQSLTVIALAYPDQQTSDRMVMIANEVPALSASILVHNKQGDLSPK